MPSYYGARITGTWANVHEGPGRLYGLIISHAEASAQTVTLYDSLTESGTIMGKFIVAPEVSPFVIFLPDQLWMAFGTGMTIQPGNCEVMAWLIGR